MIECAPVKRNYKKYRCDWYEEPAFYFLLLKVANDKGNRGN